jgi:hypothetical protein
LGNSWIIREGEAAQGSHGGDSADGFEGAKEDAVAARGSGGLAADVGAVVVSVDEIDVGVAGRSKEDGVARGKSAIGVGGGIVAAKVGFGFHDASGEDELFPTGLFFLGLGTDEEFAEEFAGDGERITGVKRAWERD